MNAIEQTDLQQSLRRLETRIHRTRILVLIILSLNVTLAVFAGHAGPEMLRVRGLVIEDAEGRPRIVLGAPIPAIPGRQYTTLPVMGNPRVEEGHMVWDEIPDARRIESTGVLILDEAGIERVVLADALPDPAVNGRIYPRRPGRHWGMLLNDEDGTERSGYGVWDSGQVSLGLDWRGREAFVLFGLPDGRAGFKMSNRDGTAGAELSSDADGESRLKLHGRKPAIELRDDESGDLQRIP